jgi:hypothetical protein
MIGSTLMDGRGVGHNGMQTPSMTPSFDKIASLKELNKNYSYLSNNLPLFIDLIIQLYLRYMKVLSSNVLLVACDLLETRP